MQTLVLLRPLTRPVGFKFLKIDIGSFTACILLNFDGEIVALSAAANVDNDVRKNCLRVRVLIIGVLSERSAPGVLHYASVADRTQ